MFIRKRPLFKEEGDKGEFDVITVDEERRRVHVHNCLMHADLKRMHLKTVAFPCAACFGATAGNEEVYARAAAPLVRHVAVLGGVATLFM